MSNSPASTTPVGRDAEVHLHVATYTVHTGGRSVERRVVDDAYRPSSGWTTCLRPGHRPATTPTRFRDEHGWDLDCPCDVACPRCGAPAGMGCTTTDGGGMSGGGYPTKAHAARIKVSARCQGLLDGTVSRCDLGDHAWVEHDERTAGCERCGRTAPLHEGRPAHSEHGHWVRR